MHKYLLFSGFILSSFCLFAQKKPLDHSVYDQWQSISEEKISNDGQYVAFSVLPQEGDSKLFIKNIKTNGLFDYPRANTLDFSFDNQFAAFLIKPLFKDTRVAKIKKKKPEEMPKDSLGIIALNNNQLWKIPRVKSFKFPKKAGNVMAYLLEKEKADSTKIKSKIEKEDGLIADDTKSEVSSEGNILVLRTLRSQIEIKFKAVTAYEFSENGKYLLFATSIAKKDTINKAGAFLYDIEKNQTIALTTGKGVYKNLVFDEKGIQIAFTLSLIHI